MSAAVVGYVASIRVVLATALRRPTVQMLIVVTLVAAAVARWYLRRLIDRIAATSAAAASAATPKLPKASSTAAAAPIRRRSPRRGERLPSACALLSDAGIGDAAAASLQHRRGCTADAAATVLNANDDGATSAQAAVPLASDNNATARVGKTAVATTITTTTATPTSTQPSRIFSSGHERLGHVVIVRMAHTNGTNHAPDSAAAAAAASAALPAADIAKAAQAFASTFRPPVHVVLSDEHGVGGELRVPSHGALWVDADRALVAVAEIVDKVARRAKKLGVLSGDGDAGAAAGAAATSTMTFRLTASALAALARSPSYTLHIEKGIRYSFDAARVMFSSGNTTERMHFGVDVAAAGETVVDMFAGIGYFTLPLAVSMSHPARIVAIEKNPDSCAYLACNTLLNDCVDFVVVLNGDNRTTGGLFVGKAQRVIMGYLPCCKAFLPRAVDFLERRYAPVTSAAAVAAPAPRSPPIAPQVADRKAVSFASGCTPPREKTDASVPSPVAAPESLPPTATATATTATTTAAATTAAAAAAVALRAANGASSNRTTCPAGTIHYHFLCDTNNKQRAAAHAMSQVTESLGAPTAALCTVAALRVVKSYAPRSFHCVADLVFAGAKLRCDASEITTPSSLAFLDA